MATDIYNHSIVKENICYDNLYGSKETKSEFTANADKGEPFFRETGSLSMATKVTKVNSGSALSATAIRRHHNVVLR